MGEFIIAATSKVGQPNACVAEMRVMTWIDVLAPADPRSSP